MKKILYSAMILSLVFVVSCKDKDKNTPVSSVSLIPKTTTRAVGTEFSLTHTVLPANATNKNVTWSSTTGSVATVTTGIVKTLVSGTTSIVVTTIDGSFTDTTFLVVAGGCNAEVPGFGSSLGTITRGTQEWTISGQVWSDAVQATNCDKTSFSGGIFNAPIYNADCRSNPDFPGDLFSWCAVIRFQDELCPAPWRVPTNEDFRKLTLALGGQILDDFENNMTLVNKYLTDWGGAFGGSGNLNGVNNGQNLHAMYWAQTEFDERRAFSIYFDSNGDTFSQRWFNDKGDGYTLRCVRDN
jgi:uncharacterized protein (TIGR02145 family)